VSTTRITLHLLLGFLVLAGGASAQGAPAVRDSKLPERHQMSQFIEGKGVPDGGLLAICRADRDTLVLGEPAIFQFGVVNVGNEPAHVIGGGYCVESGCIPVMCIVNPAGSEYHYMGTAYRMMGHSPEHGVTLPPGDSLNVVLRFSRYMEYDLLFSYPGRWGIYGAYLAELRYTQRRDRAELTDFTRARCVSNVAWVDVVLSDEVDHRAWAVFRRIHCYLSYNEWSCCPGDLEHLSEVVEDHAGSVFYHHSLYGMGLCLENRKDYEEAIKYFQRYVAEFPGNLLAGEALFEIGECLHELGRYDEALSVFERARQHSPRSWRAAPRFLQEYNKREPWGYPRLY
jgi:hypothetical protein